MKLMKKAICATLVCAMALSMTACGKSKLDKQAEKLTEILEDMDYEEIDQKKATKKLDDLDADWDGFYTKFDAKEGIKAIGILDKKSAKDVTDLYVASHKIIEDGSKNAMFVYVFEYKDEDTAEDYYDDFVDEASDTINDFKDSMEYAGDDVEIEFYDDEDDDHYKGFVSVAMDEIDLDMFMSYDILLDGNTITYILFGTNVSGGDEIADEYEDFYDAWDDESPMDLAD